MFMLKVNLSIAERSLILATDLELKKLKKK
jgi:hypothetical protein